MVKRKPRRTDGSDLLRAVKLAYRKHALNDDSIGWNELTDTLHNALCNAIGADGYLEWMREIKND